jgi:hypothetical protein
MNSNSTLYFPMGLGIVRARFTRVLERQVPGPQLTLDSRKKKSHYESLGDRLASHVRLSYIANTFCKK